MQNLFEVNWQLACLLSSPCVLPRWQAQADVSLSCELEEHQICRRVFHIPDKEASCPRDAHCHSECSLLPLTCKLFRKCHMQTLSEPMVKIRDDQINIIELEV